MASASKRLVGLDRVAGSNFSYQHLGFERFLDDMVELDRRHVELWGVAPYLHITQLTADDLGRIRRQLQDRALSVVCLTPEQVMYPVNIASPVDGLRTGSIAMFRRAVEVCVELESPLLFLTAGRGFEDEPRGDAWRRSVDSIREIARYADSHGIECVLEPLQRVESNLVLSAADARQMLDDVDAPNLGVTLDTVAMVAAGDSIADYVSLFGAQLRHVHLIDGCPTGHLAWGDGELPLGEYLTALGEVEYHGFMTVELFGDGSYALDPLPALRRSYAAISAACAQSAGAR